MITASITVRNDVEQPEWFVGDIGDSPEEFIQVVQEQGGVWFGTDFFIPYTEITEFFFDDSEEEDAKEEVTT